MIDKEWVIDQEQWPAAVLWSNVKVCHNNSLSVILVLCDKDLNTTLSEYQVSIEETKDKQRWSFNNTEFI